MDVISAINYYLNILYSYVPKDLVIIILAGLTMLLIQTINDKRNKKRNEEKK